MIKNFKKISTVFVVTLTLALISTGCNSDEKKSIDDNISNDREGLDIEQPNDLTGDRNINKGNVTESDINGNVDLNDRNLDNNAMMERAKNLSTKLSDLDNVNSANVLITGKTALVGIDIPKDSSNENVTKIKDSVKAKVKEIDKEIDNVVVTADADLITRMKNLGTDVESGKPISGLGSEIEEIIKRITPNM